MKRIFLTLICLALVSQRARAPIYGVFDGLNKLIDRSEFVLIAEIIKGPRDNELDFGSGGIFEIRVVRVLKGEAKADTRATAYLRDLPFTIGLRDSGSLTYGFIPGQLYLLFLNKPGTHIHEPDGKPPPVDFENANSEGDAIWVSMPSAPGGYLDLQSLKGKSLRESVVTLLKHSATQQAKFVAGINTLIQRRAFASWDRTTPLLRFSGNAEEAARFYVAIFRDPSRPYPSGRSEISRIYQDRTDETNKTGKVRAVRFFIDDQMFLAVNDLTETHSPIGSTFALNCDSDDEVNYFKTKLSVGGQQLDRHLIKDKFGILWSIDPPFPSEFLPPREAEGQSSK